MVRESSSKRYAFTLIELIFAIVVIAISIMSLPMMTRVTAKGMQNNLLQEAIFASAAELSRATTFVWDDASLLDAIPTISIDELSRVINVNAVNDCTDSGSTDSLGNAIWKRPGHISRRCLNNPAPEPSTGNSNSLHQAADTNFKSPYERRDTNSAGIFDKSGYKVNYESKVTVKRCGGTTCVDFNDLNMKEIEVIIKQKLEDGTYSEVKTRLRTYSANIGEVTYAKEML